MSLRIGSGQVIVGMREWITLFLRLTVMNVKVVTETHPSAGSGPWPQAVGHPSTSHWATRLNNDNGGIDVPVPDTTIGNVFFRDNSSIIMEHANGLKRYNGLGGTAPEWEYCSWSSQLQTWVFNGFNNLGFDYVTNICNTIP